MKKIFILGLILIFSLSALSFSQNDTWRYKNPYQYSPLPSPYYTPYNFYLNTVPKFPYVPAYVPYYSPHYSNWELNMVKNDALMRGDYLSWKYFKYLEEEPWNYKRAVVVQQPPSNLHYFLGGLGDGIATGVERGLMERERRSDRAFKIGLECLMDPEKMEWLATESGQAFLKASGLAKDKGIQIIVKGGQELLRDREQAAHEKAQERTLTRTPFYSYYDKSTSKYYYFSEAGSEPIIMSFKSGTEPDENGLALFEKMGGAVADLWNIMDEMSPEEIKQLLKDYSARVPELIPLIGSKLLTKRLEKYEKEKIALAEDLAFLEKEGFVSPARRAQLLEYIKKTNFLSLFFLFL
jgi:hypothetical protein